MDISKRSARVARHPNGCFSFEVFTPEQNGRGAVLAIVDSRQSYDNLTFAELVAKIREVFPEVAETE